MTTPAIALHSPTSSASLPTYFPSVAKIGRLLCYTPLIAYGAYHLYQAAKAHLYPASTWGQSYHVIEAQRLASEIQKTSKDGKPIDELFQKYETHVDAISLLSQEPLILSLITSLSKTPSDHLEQQGKLALKLTSSNSLAKAAQLIQDPEIRASIFNKAKNSCSLDDLLLFAKLDNRIIRDELKVKLNWFASKTSIPKEVFQIHLGLAELALQAKNDDEAKNAILTCCRIANSTTETSLTIVRYAKIFEFRDKLNTFPINNNPLQNTSQLLQGYYEKFSKVLICSIESSKTFNDITPLPIPNTPEDKIKAYLSCIEARQHSPLIMSSDISLKTLTQKAIQAIQQLPTDGPLTLTALKSYLKLIQLNPQADVDVVKIENLYTTYLEGEANIDLIDIGDLFSKIFTCLKKDDAQQSFFNRFLTDIQQQLQAPSSTILAYADAAARVDAFTESQRKTLILTATPLLDTTSPLNQQSYTLTVAQAYATFDPQAALQLLKDHWTRPLAKKYVQRAAIAIGALTISWTISWKYPVTLMLTTLGVAGSHWYYAKSST